MQKGRIDTEYVQVTALVRANRKFNKTNKFIYRIL